MEAPPLDTSNVFTPDRRNIRILVSVGLLTLIGDFLLWPAPIGVSAGLFAAVICAALLLRHAKAAHTRAFAIASCLLLGTVVQTAIELSFSNLLVLLLLLTAIVGEVLFPELRSSWIRWAEGAGTLFRAPLGWSWVRGALKQIPSQPARARDLAVLCTQVGIPTLAIAVVFVVLFSSGNAIFAKGISEVFSRSLDVIPSFSFGRTMVWLVLATLGLGILRPAIPFFGEKTWLRRIPNLPEPRDLRLARWRSLSILAALNILFFAVNTIDAFYLWIHGKLPADVNYSEFVHQGVQSLTLAVLLSVLVLVVIYQQSNAVVGSKALRILALAWIGQNVLLIASVLLRLKLYVNAYQLSALRIYVAFFLGLVAVGFGLLAWRIIASKKLEWLLRSNILATFSLFFAVQFLDVAGWVADYNVARWQKDVTRTLDVEYLAQLGPSAYRGLIAVAETPGRAEAHRAFILLQLVKEAETKRLANVNWRSRQMRSDGNARLLVNHEVRTRR